MRYPNLKAEMARKGITAFDMAKAVGVHQTTFSLWVTGKRSMPLEKALAIARELESSVDYLFA